MSNRIHSFYGRKPVYRPSRSRIYVNDPKIYTKPLGLMMYRINKGDGEFCFITFKYMYIAKDIKDRYHLLELSEWPPLYPYHRSVVHSSLRLILVKV